jgi:A/G-specific adenine glycosylase
VQDLADVFQLKEFQKCLLKWFKKNGRSFFWRREHLNLWQWLVLEILLKRTRAETVEKFFPSFIAKYSNPKIIIQTEDQELENDLRFLGLQSQRRISLKKIAETIVRNYGGKTPLEYDSLISLPYVGRYVANAVLCFSQNQRRPIVDVNIARVLSRFNGLEMPKDVREEWIWELADRMLPDKNWKEYNYALIDLGARVCKTKNPICSECWILPMCAKGNEFLRQHTN